MRRALLPLLLFVAAPSFARQGGEAGITAPATDRGTAENTSTTMQNNRKGVLVAYFSCTNNTKGIAEKIAGATGGKLWRIEPQVAYTAADLDWHDDNCRANREQKDSNARPPLKQSTQLTNDCAVLFLGYPIWWYIAPRVIDTFLEQSNLEGVLIVPFCTSGSSPVGKSDTNLHALAPKAIWKDGKRFRANENAEGVAKWVKGLGLNL